MTAFIMEWSVFHNYRHLVDDGKAKSLKCPNCDGILVTQPDIDADPLLWCILCDVRFHPGLDLYSQIRAVVMEHHTDENA